MSLSYETPEYFLNFQCLGGDCEDTCCQHWEIKLDKQHYRILRDVMSGDEHEQQLFNRYIKINDQPVSGDHDYAFITTTESGYCPMLGEDGLCIIHGKYGVQPLGNVCAFYPRVISRRWNKIEMSGAISCPEVARRCLFSEEPLRYVKFSPSILPRPRNYPIQRELPANERDHYALHFPYVRKKFLSIAANTAYALETRLYALVTLAHTLSGFYHKDCVVAEEEKLEQVISSFIQSGNMDKIAMFVSNHEISEPVGLIVINSILRIKQENFPDEKVSQLASSIMQSYTSKYGETDTGMPDGVELNVFYQQHRNISVGVFAREFDQYISRYVENVLYREWFYTMPDPFTYIQMLLVRVAILRYLIYANPKLVELAQKYANTTDSVSADDLAELKNEVIYVVYNFARAIDQNIAFLQVIYNALSEQQMINFDYSLSFIRI